MTEILETNKDEIAELKDRLLRTQAELENYRKRCHREIEDIQKYAEANLICDLLPVIDDVNRAIEYSKSTEDCFSGLRSIQDRLKKIFVQHNCSIISKIYAPFDPTTHEAISQEINEKYPDNTVLKVVSVGTSLYDRVLRPAKVIVSTKSVVN